MNDNLRSIIVIVAALAVLAATILFLSYPEVSAIMLGAGGILLIIARMTRKLDGLPMRIKRASRIEIFSSLLITASAWFLYSNQREWIAILLAAAFLQLYASFIIGRVTKKEKQEQENMPEKRA